MNMNTRTIIYSIITLAIFSSSLHLMNQQDLLLAELGKATLLLSIVSIFPLAESYAKAQLMNKPYESTQIRELTQEVHKKKVA